MYRKIITKTDCCEIFFFYINKNKNRLTALREFLIDNLEDLDQKTEICCISISLYLQSWCLWTAWKKISPAPSSDLHLDSYMWYIISHVARWYLIFVLPVFLINFKKANSVNNGPSLRWNEIAIASHKGKTAAWAVTILLGWTAGFLDFIALSLWVHKTRVPYIV